MLTRQGRRYEPQKRVSIPLISGLYADKEIEMKAKLIGVSIPLISGLYADTMSQYVEEETKSQSL